MIETVVECVGCRDAWLSGRRICASVVGAGLQPTLGRVVSASLLLTPSIDHLFDRGFIGFEDNGRLIISPVAHQPSLQRMGIDTTRAVNVGAFTSGQKQFLDFHRNDVLLKSIRS
jgi:hypothetical protein